jgi:RHS repeat-associated protein
MTCEVSAFSALQTVRRRLQDAGFLLLALSSAVLMPATGRGQIVDSFQPGQGVFNESYSPLATVEPAKGLARATVPFRLNAARGSAQPALNLVYSSEGGALTAGTGWGLDLPSIERVPLSNPGVALGDRYVFAGHPIVPVCPPQQSQCPQTSAENMPTWATTGAGSPWTYYRAQVEGAFMRLFLSADGNTWRVEMKNGVTMEFGLPLTPTAGTPAIDGQFVPSSGVIPPKDSRFRWNLVRQFDSQFDSQDVPHPVNLVLYQWSQSIGDLGLNYLTDIFDTPRPGQDLDQVNSYAHHTHLQYEQNPDFLNVSHAQVWRATPDRRLAQVDVTSANFAGSGPRELVRRYHLAYQTMLHSSYLASVQLEGRCATPQSEAAGLLPANTSCPMMPATTFQYTQHTGTALPQATPISIVNPNPGQRFLWDPIDLGVIDVNRDGLPDIVQGFPTFVPNSSPNTSTLGVYLNTPIAPTVVLNRAAIDASTIAVALGPGSTSTFMSAANGISIAGWWGNECRLCVLFSALPDPNPNPKDLYLSAYPQFVDLAPPPPAPQLFEWQWTTMIGGTLNTQLPKLFLVADIDGDGLLDALDTSNHLWFSVKDLSPGSDVNHFIPFSNQVSPNISLAPPAPELPQGLQTPSLTLFADMNGDGLPDFVTAINIGTPQEQYVYFPGDGTGKFQCLRPANFCQPPSSDLPPPACFNCPPPPNYQAAYLPLQFEGNNTPPTLLFLSNSVTHLYFHDVNGDGLADIIAVSPGLIQIWWNLDGIHFKAMPSPYVTIPTRGEIARVTFADMNGNGTDDIVLIYPDAAYYVDTAIVQAEPLPVRQGLLSEISNGLGATTIIHYGNTADLDALAAGTADAWSNHSQKLEYVVRRLETSTNLPAPYQITHLVTYTYKDPIYDDWQQAFLGFRHIRETRSGDLSDLDTTTDTTYFFGGCQPPNNGTCSQTSDDDEWKAVTGVPIVSEIYDGLGTHYSTTVWDYQSNVLFKGAGDDSRSVRFAYPKRTDTWLYDAGNFTASPQTVPLPVVEISNSSGGLSHAPEIITAAVPLASTLERGRAHIRSEQTMDQWGNIIHAVDDGQIQDNGTAIDMPMVAAFGNNTPKNHWHWQTSTVNIAPYLQPNGLPIGLPRSYSFQYDPRGNLSAVSATLTGTLPLDRFHEDPTKQVAPTPGTASVDNPNLQLSSFIHDTYGNLTHVQGPDGVCGQTTYEDAYKQLATVSTSYTGGCNIGGLTTKTTYDRGLGAAISSTSPTTSQSAISYDGFGRAAAVYEPDPNTGHVSAAPSLKVCYVIANGGPTQLVHVQRIDVSNLYRDSWIYLDGFGKSILELDQADPGAGDGGKWVASGLALPNAKGSVFKTFQPWFYNQDPQNYPIAVPANVDSIFTHDGLERVTQVFRLDLTHGLVRKVYHALSQDDWDAENLLANGSHFGLTSSILRDGHGRAVVLTRQLKTSQGLDKLTTRLTYLATGEMVAQSQRHSLGSEQVLRTMQYDSLGRLVENIEPNTSTVNSGGPCTVGHPCKNIPVTRGWRYAYDDAGHLVGTSDARGCGENFFYDGHGRKLAEGYSPCRSYQPDYTSPPNLTDGSNTQSFFRYDAPEPGQSGDFGPNAAFLAGKLAASNDLGAHTRYAWDGRGRSLGAARQIATPAGSTSLQTRYAPWWFRYTSSYDTANRISEQSTGADVNELLVPKIILGNNGIPQIVNSSLIDPLYSARGMLKGLASSYGQLISSVEYDVDGALVDQVYGDAAATDTHLTYDPMRRLQEFKVWRAAPALWSHSAGQYTPPANSPSTLQLVLEDLVFEDDAVNNPLSVADHRSGGEWLAGSQPVSRQISYDDLYRVKSITYQNGADTQVSPFESEIAVGDISPVPMRTVPKRVQTQLFSYDFLDNRTTSTDDAGAFYDRSLGTITNGIQQAPNPAAGQQPNQLISAISAAGEKLAAHYDAAGNLEDLSVARKGTCSSPSGCMQRFAYEWDEAGRLSRARRWDFVTIPPNEPVYPALPTSSAARDLRYKYDAAGIRVLKSVADASGNQLHSATVFDSLRLDNAKWDASSGNYERTASTETAYLGSVARLFYSTQPLPTVAPTNLHVLFVIGDPSGSTAAVIDHDTGEVVESPTYQGFGSAETDDRPARWASFRENYRFTGKEDDIEVGLTYFGARYYHAALGRWMSPDPLTIHGLVADPNPYAYVRSSPLRFVDHLGLEEDDGGGCDDPACDDTQVTAALGANGVDGNSPTVTGPVSYPMATPPPVIVPPPATSANGFVSGTSGASGATNPRNDNSWWSVTPSEKRDLERIAAASGQSKAILLGAAGAAVTIDAIAASAIVNAPTWQHAWAALYNMGIAAGQFAAAINGNSVSVGGDEAAEETETFYRTMSQSNYDQLLATGKLPATSETFVSPSLEYASQYKGVAVQFTMQSGTTDSLLGMGVRNAGLSGGAYDSLPLVQRGWGSSSAFFKLEGVVVNIGLGRGTALDTFNNMIVNFRLIRK